MRRTHRVGVRKLNCSSFCQTATPESFSRLLYTWALRACGGLENGASAGAGGLLGQRAEK